MNLRSLSKIKGKKRRLNECEMSGAYKQVVRYDVVRSGDKRTTSDICALVSEINLQAQVTESLQAVSFKTCVLGFQT